jgi:uncharacterized protein involved in response to NO
MTTTHHLVSIDPPRGRAPRPAPPAFALWALGFRPFYLLAALFAALSVPLWALQFAGWLPHAVLQGPAWHAHEMLFGFTLAVIVGFLFTAGRNWSGQPTPTGGALMALALLWLAGRVLVMSPWPLAAALANVAFPWAAAWGLGRALVAGGNRRNYFFVALLVLMGLLAAVVHAAAWRGWALQGSAALQLGLDVVLLIMAIMAGRVVPMFTNNGVPGAQAVRHSTLEKAAIGSVLVLLALDAGPVAGLAPPPALLALVAAAAAVLHAWRLGLWQPWKTHGAPLVWVLHLACAWIPLHLLLRAGAAAAWWPPGPATHALTTGAVGLLTLAMMTRSARGHTGRPLRADRIDVASYGLVALAAVLRTAVPLLWPAGLVEAALASALAWSAGWALFAWHYGPWLCRARLDGQPG